MPTPTYDLIASNVLSSSASSVTFSSIPDTYRDLILVIQASTSSLSYLSYRINGDTGSNYSVVYAEGTGSVAQSSSFTDTFGYLVPGDAGRSNTSSPSLTVAQFFDYAQSKHKTVLARANNTTTGTSMSASRWASTATVTSIVLATTAGNFETGASFYLYGIVS